MQLDEWRARPLIFVENIDHPLLSDADVHHFRRVRRLADGSPVVLADGAGSWRPARFGEPPVVEGPVEYLPPPSSPTTVGFTPVKGDRPEWVVQKLTEVGIDRIIPLQTRRSVVRWDDSRAAKQRRKLAMVAREAAMQCRRVRLPEIFPVMPLHDALAQGWVDPEERVPVVFAEPGGPPLDGSTDRFVVIGPEGGWDPSELDGSDIRSLPGNVLRAETATIVAATLLVARAQITKGG